jgi:predicted nucleic acid-binding protein
LRLYLDTSALVKLYVEEEGSALVREAVEQAGTVATSAVAYAEARAAFARIRRERRLSLSDHRRVVRDFDADWQRYVSLEVTESLIRRAAELAESHALRAYDAIHLASARLLRERLKEPVVFSAWDSGLVEAAWREDMETVSPYER